MATSAWRDSLRRSASAWRSDLITAASAAVLCAGLASAARADTSARGLSGTLFVTDSTANRVHALDAATGAILASADTEEHPIGVEKANGKVYVANEASDTVSVYGSATLSPLTVVPACDKPHHTAVPMAPAFARPVSAPTRSPWSTPQPMPWWDF